MSAFSGSSFPGFTSIAPVGRMIDLYQVQGPVSPLEFDDSREKQGFMDTQRSRQWSVLAASTLSFTVCFAVWMMFAVIGIPIKQTLGLNETQFGLLAAMPVLTGSLIRLPLGMWTDKFGGRIVFFILMLSTVVPIWLRLRTVTFPKVAKGASLRGSE
jgi:sugar phosphate permease